MKPTVALIVNTYNQPDYLARVLRAVSMQEVPPEEVLLADDGSGEETRRVFAGWAAAQQCTAHHIWHEKKGFRRSRILNASIAEAQSDYMVFLDGDTVPHPRFVADHQSLARPGFFIQGHRVLVTQRASLNFGTGDFCTDRYRAFFAGQLLGFKHIFRWPAPFRWVKPNLDGVRGCNLSVWRSDLLHINGYNENYFGWGCEDLDLALRLMNAGIRRLDVRGHALCYHLWHPLLDRSNLPANQKILDETASKKLVTCEHGLEPHLTNRFCTVWTKRAAAAPQKPAAKVVPPLQFGVGELSR